MSAFYKINLAFTINSQNSIIGVTIENPLMQTERKNYLHSSTMEYSF